MEFKLLGPLELRHCDGAVVLDRPKERALLLFLLLHPNEPVSVDLLLESLWAGATPSSAKRSLQVHVSRLRTAFGREAERLSFGTQGYLLRVESGELDADRFEALVEAGRRALRLGDPIEAAVVLRDALALWRGPPLTDVAYESFAQPTIERLEELLMVGLAGRVAADLRLGRHEAVLPELRFLATRYPAHEPFCELLMLALYRSGRQQDALDVYRDAREQLIRERGLEPTPRLRHLERAILNHEASLTADVRGGWQPAHGPASSRRPGACSDDGGRAARRAARVSALAEAAAPHLRSADQIAWFRALDAEEEAIWDACRGALGSGSQELVLRLGAALWPHWEARGWLDEARSTLDEALASSPPSAPARGGALIGAGRIALRQGDTGHAGRCFASALPLLTATQDAAGFVLAQSGLSWVSLGAGDLDVASALARNAVERARSLDASWVTGDALNTLGTVARVAGDLDGARLSLEEALALRREAADLEGVAATLGSLAWCNVADDDLDAAEALFREGSGPGLRRNDLWYSTAVELALAYVELARGDLDAARERTVRGLRACRRLGTVQLSRSALRMIASVDVLRGGAGDAAILAGAAVASGPRGEATSSAYGWESAAVDDALGRGRERLGAFEWDRRVARGAALSQAELDELVLA